ncbi:hypothetical protein Cylst_0839 [Cylindrospermum stagnale PCC 7417]|uniref:Uncharacterized protein n=1 Tax=Cylindrospermum stagnale PCC 7417 TaxID=56107 RepID=K9WS11_9NOST|nr:hypothetical protein [Cylindrospermum stagnale]AFZ23165.1 hypothetical protein Cylst_0839 [Cylindrospermum stagnale PCC 7417]
MLNNISKFFPSHRWKIPFVGLLLASGIVGVGVVGQQTKPVLSNQIEKFPSFTAQTIDAPTSTKTPLLSRLREVREQRSQTQSAAFESKNLEKLDQPKLANSTIVRSKLVSSASLSKNVETVATATKELGVLPTVNFPKKDGIYLYGQSTQPNQPGEGYIVFQKQQSRVMGALYTPNSEFSCFQGTVGQSGELAMTVTASPGEGSTTQVSTTSKIPKVSDDESFTYAYSVELQDYNRLNSLSANDRRILRICNQVSNGSYSKLVN